MKGLFYKGKKIADRGYIINLPHRTDRLESSTKLLDELGFTGYEIFEGVVMENPEFKKLGSTASFLKIFEEVLKSDDQDLIVFEDDIKLIDNVNKFDLDKIFNDWDGCYVANLYITKEIL